MQAQDATEVRSVLRVLAVTEEPVWTPGRDDLPEQDAIQARAVLPAG